MPDDKQFDVQGARKAGYSDDEIVSHLAQSKNFDLEGAKSAGYSTQDILYHLVPNQGLQFTDKVTGTGSLTQGAGTSFVDTLKGMMPPTPEGPVLSKKFWLGNNTVGIHPTQGGIAKAGSEMANEYGRARQAGAGPLSAGISSGVVGAGSLLGVSDAEQQKLAEQGESGKIVGQSAAPIAATIAAPLVGKMVGGLPRSTPAPVETGGLSPDVTGTIGRTIGHATRIPGAGALGEFLGKKFGTETPVAAPEGESPASIQAERLKRSAAYAEMNEDFAAERKKRMAAHAEMEQDFADRREQQAKDLAKKIADNENARQKEITDWAKLDKVSEADHQAFQDRIAEIEQENQKNLADMERLKQQHADSLVRRGQEQATMDAAHEQRMSDIEDARQGDLAAQERLKLQHAEALNARGAKKSKGGATPPPPSPFEGMTSSAPGAVSTSATLPSVPQGQPTLFPQVQRPGGMTTPPLPLPEPIPVSAKPTIGSQIAARAKAGKSSILSRGTTLVDLTQPPDPANPLHNEVIQDYQTRSGEQLRTQRAAGDKFAGFVLRHFPRP